MPHHSPRNCQPGWHAVVRGPLAAALALEWRFGSAVVPVVVVLAGPSWRQVEPIDRWLACSKGLLRAPATRCPVPPGMEPGLAAYVRKRLAAALDGPRDTDTTSVACRLVRLARIAASVRNADRLVELESALSQLITGVPIGWLRDLCAAMDERPPWPALRRWLRERGTAGLTGSGRPPVVVDRDVDPEPGAIAKALPNGVNGVRGFQSA